jgi:hypothetical protein
VKSSTDSDDVTEANGELLRDVYRERYEHERQLGAHTAAFEHASLRPAILLNGGAVVAFLTLIGAVWKVGGLPDLQLAGRALLAWSAGLIAGSLATGFGYGSQRAFQRMIRFQRERIERRLVPGLHLEQRDQSEEGREGKRGKRFQRMGEALVLVSFVAFLAGSLFAFQSLQPKRSVPNSAVEPEDQAGS